MMKLYIDSATKILKTFVEADQVYAMSLYTYTGCPKYS